MNLGVDQAKMDTFIYSPDGVHIKKLECLQAYFKQGEAKWSEVVKAIESYPINNKPVARNIAKVYRVNLIKGDINSQDDL